MKKYILFTDEELHDMLNGREVEHHTSDNCVLYFMSKEHFSKLADESITDEEWDKAIAHLNMYIVEYASIGWAGQFGLNGVLVPLKKRFDKGERTRELYDAMMNVE